MFEFEVCAESVAATIAAREGGADRIELCSALSEGGLTPSDGLIRAAVRESGLPVHMILRPRGGDFVYSEVEFELMLAELEHGRQLGVSGFVFGMLDVRGRVDTEKTKRVVEAAGGLEVTFHRAFDCARDLPEALEEVIGTGCRRVLTSGGGPSVLEGAEVLSGIVAQAGERIKVALGGGLRLAHAAELAQRTRARAFHGSMRRLSQSPHGCIPGETSCPSWSVDPEDIRAMIRTLKGGLG
jgi:copper homeostasis protein